MANTPNVVLPEEHEKLGFKFILDRRNRSDAPVDNSETAPSEVVCGTLSSEPTELDIVIPAEREPEATDRYIPVELELGKKYFRIGEVAELIGVEPYVLRYWESEFSTIRPVKSGSGHRVYQRRDVETLHRIKHLLYVEKFSIKGAKKKLSEKKTSSPVATSAGDSRELRELVKELKELVHLARHLPL